MVQALQITKPKRHWTSGLPMIGLSGSLLLAYFQMSYLTEDWSISNHILFRAVVVLVGMVGLAQVAAGTTGSRGGLSAPRIGRNRIMLANEGIVYLAIMFVLLAGAMLTKQNTLLLVFSVMAGPFVVNGWLTYGMLQTARIGRTVPQRAMAGELFDVELQLSNRHPFLSAWLMFVRDEVTDGGKMLEAEVLFARVPSRGSLTGHYLLRLMRRGRHSFGSIQISSRYPLGLVERSRIFSVPGEILIHPRIGRVNAKWKNRQVGATELIARPQHHAGLFHDEFHGLREFRTGDNPRDIHWRSSARRGELILREFQQNRDVHLAVVLDLWSSSRREARIREHDELVERVLSFVATLLVQHGRESRESHLHLFAAGETTFRWVGQATVASLESLFDGLAVFEAGTGSETKAMLDAAIQQTSAATQIVFVSTRPLDQEDQEELVWKAAGNPRIQVVRLLQAGDLDGILTFE